MFDDDGNDQDPAQSRPKGRPMLFSRWGAFVYRFRRPIALLTIALAIAAAIAGSRVTSALSAGGWIDPTSESAAVSTRLNDEFGAGRGSLVALFQAPPGTDAKAPATQEAIAASLARLAADSRVESLVGFAQTGDARFISKDGSSAYVVVRLAQERAQPVAAPATRRREAAREWWCG